MKRCESFSSPSPPFSQDEALILMVISPSSMRLFVMWREGTFLKTCLVYGTMASIKVSGEALLQHSP